MTQFDKHGREYLKLCDAKVCQRVELDGYFTCHPGGEEVLLQDYEGGPLHFICAEGNHNIEGQDDGDGYCIGIYPLK